MAVVSWGLVGVIVGLVATAGGGYAVWLLAHNRRLALDDRDDAADQLATLREKKRALMPSTAEVAAARPALPAGPIPEGTPGVFASTVRNSGTRR
jgi:hypothetical protein